MRFQITVLVSFLFLTPCQATEKGAGDDPADFIKRLVAAFNDNDAEKLSEFYDQSPQTEVLVSSGYRHQGFEAVRKAYRDDQKQLRYYDSEALKISAHLLGDTAIATFEHRFKFQFHQDESHWQVHVRTSTVLREVEGEWKIVHEHSSAIRDIDKLAPLKE